MMEEQRDLRKQDPVSPRLSTMNDEINKVKCKGMQADVRE